MSNSNRYGQHIKNEKNKSKDFVIIREPQKLYAEILRFSANSPKEYRFNISSDMWKLCRKLVYQVRIANSMMLGTNERVKRQKKCIKTMDKIRDLLPVYSQLRCISLEQEAAFSKRFDNYRFTFRKWLESDRKRLTGEEFNEMREILGYMMNDVLIVDNN